MQNATPRTALFVYATTPKGAPYRLYVVPIGKRGSNPQVIAEERARYAAHKDGYALAGGYYTKSIGYRNETDTFIIVPENGRRKDYPKARATRWIADSDCTCGNSCYGDCWDMFVNDLDGLMESKRPTGFWRADGANMGWQARTGYKYFTAANATELLRAILPDTDCTVRVKNTRNRKRVITMRVSHHDAPMGESYFIRPVSGAEYEANA